MNPLEKLHALSPETITDPVLKKMHTRALDFYEDREKLSPAELDMYEGVYQQIMEHITAKETAAREAEEQKKQQRIQELKNIPLPHVEAMKLFGGKAPREFSQKSNSIASLFAGLVKDPDNDKKKAGVQNASQKLTNEINQHLKAMAAEKQKQEEKEKNDKIVAENKRIADEKTASDAAEAKRIADEEAAATAAAEAKKNEEDEIAATEAKRQADDEEARKKKEADAREQTRLKQEHDEDPVNMLLGDTD